MSYGTGLYEVYNKVPVPTVSRMRRPDVPRVPHKSLSLYEHHRETTDHSTVVLFFFRHSTAVACSPKVMRGNSSQKVRNSANDEIFQFAEPATFHSLTYSEIATLVGLINFEASTVVANSSNSNGHGRYLPPEVCRKVAHFFSIRLVRHEDVSTIAASSTSGHHPLESVLQVEENGRRSSWWISGPGSMPGGQGEEYVQFRLDPLGRMRRLQAVSIVIPIMPSGPCSVWQFRIDYLQHELPQQWKSYPTTFSLNQKSGFQKKCLDVPIDATEIRIVCLTNQMKRWLTDDNFGSSLYSQVGFFAIKFE